MDVNNLESAINSAKGEGVSKAEIKNESVKMSEEEKRGFHKGALNTLVAERDELIKMVRNVEAIIQAHISRLKELGVNIK